MNDEKIREKNREYMRKRRQSEEFRAKQSEYAREQAKLPHVKERIQAYENLPKVRARRKKYRQSSRGKASSKRYIKKIKTEAFLAYSTGEVAKCVCCGESDSRFLTVDHVNGDGSEHRKKLGVNAGWQFLSRLKKLGWPNNPPMQIHCWNCNCARHINGGICPHMSGIEPLVVLRKP